MLRVNHFPWYLYTFFGNTGLEFGINDDGVTNYCNWNATDGAIKGVDVAQAILNITTNPAFISQPDGDFITGVQNGTLGAGISGVWNAVSVRERSRKTSNLHGGRTAGTDVFFYRL